MEGERLRRQLSFLLEIDRAKEIVRQTYLADGSRKENDAEHSWHLALMCLLLREYANEPIDVLHTMTMVLIHDLIEIDAGDTYAYDAAGEKTKQVRELAAAERIFALLPPDQAAYLRALWDEFEAGESPEAKFAATLDRLQPLLLNDASGGRSWLEHEVRAEQVRERNQRTSLGSETLGTYALELIEKNRREGKLREKA